MMFRLVLILITLIYLALFPWLHLRQDDRELRAILHTDQGMEQVEVDRVFSGQDSVRYVVVGRPKANFKSTLIMFIHGSPASLSIWNGYLKDSGLLSRYSLGAVDRPGYGYSSYGEVITSVARQGRGVAAVLEHLRDRFKSIVLVGSSYGGTVAAQVAASFPDLVEGIVFISSSLKPEAETTYWITYPTSHWLMKWMLTPALRQANAEKLSHAGELKQLAPLLKNIVEPIYILHGDNDGLVFFENAAYLQKQAIGVAWSKIQSVPGGQHNLLWTGRDKIMQAIEEVVNRVEYASPFAQESMPLAK